jgi:chemotaxis protein CheD
LAISTTVPPRPGRTRNLITVEIGGMKVCKSPADVIVTHSLGSCVGLTLFDPLARVGGMVNCLLPLAAIDPQNALAVPCMFVDTGVAALLREMLAQGAQVQNLIAKAAGAGSPLGGGDALRLGERNLTVLCEVLGKSRITIAKQDTGGAKARTLYLYVGDGRTTVKTEGAEVEL